MKTRTAARTLLIASLALSLALAPLALAGCTPAEDAPGTSVAPEASELPKDEASPPADGQEGPSEDEPVQEEPAEYTFLVYFSYAGDRALGVERTAEHPGPAYEVAITELLDGPTAAELETWPVLGTQIPDGTSLLSVTLLDGVAWVDLSREFESGGGSWSVTARVAQIVYTLTQFEVVQGVRFSIEGEHVRVFTGEGLILDRPQTAEDYYDSVPIDA